jgi:transcriptional regulator with XRE-family HTH domain
MISVGSTLRRKREAEGLSVEEIAARLCISPSYLRAIEEDNVARLPGTFFYRSFALQYAAFLGAEDASVRSAIDETCAPKNDPVDAAGAVAQRAAPSIQFAGISRSRTGYAIGLALLLCAAAGSFAWRNRVPGPQIVSQPRSVMIAALPESTEPEQAEAELIESVPGTVLNLAARETTWLSITSDGVEIFEGMLWARQSKTLTGLEMAQMKVGNAGGLDIFWNGKPVGPIGKTGQVRVVLLSADDVQVLPPGRTL